jgi:hypothetical protein
MSFSMQFCSLHPADSFLAGQMWLPIVVKLCADHPLPLSPQGHKMKPFHHDINLNSGG